MYTHHLAQPDPRLGRHVQHDPRSLRYAHGVLPQSAIKTVDWQRRAPIFDQGSVGSCTGNAAAGLLGTDSSARPGLTSVTISGNAVPVDEQLAVQVYSLATQLDSIRGAYPPDDTGSSGLGAAKALVKLGLAAKYTHAFSLDALNSALQAGPVMVGTLWLESMFNIDPDGYVVVDRKSQVAGGHEYVISAYDADRKAYRLDNSWGESWGAHGSAWYSQTNLAWLLSQDGDVTVPVWSVAPSPKPALTAADLASQVRALLAVNGV
ncbi:hypothetical protein [Streptomyces natalensis]|uniref:Peptidase C1A papain C-terminal domain-containing protein n=1 Tax=Streptomyces natalensis ATCC 27448 TaxID=1240678 RepID=A0A0D7CKW9_9ACTN|nr:hypothetical protein [Streptomyces natalensis]KIZ16823.1 hypothetical protein SNA_17640 [Streptomyces natalensis ATCC 27448]